MPHCSLRNNPEGRSYHLRRGGSPKSRPQPMFYPQCGGPSFTPIISQSKKELIRNRGTPNVSKILVYFFEGGDCESVAADGESA